MKKHYITPEIKSVNILINESMMLTGSLGNDTTTTMDGNRRRTWSSDQWHSGWED